MRNSVKSHLLWITMGSKLYGSSTRLHSLDYIESDGRKQKKALRELVEAGYLSQTGDEFHVTEKCWDEVQVENVDLISIWEKDRKFGWNKRHKYPFVRWRLLSFEQQKSVLECDAQYQWYICNHLPLQYDRPMQDGDLAGPMPHKDNHFSEKINELDRQVKTRLEQEKRGGHFPETEIVLKTDGLTKHVEKVLGEERFISLYQTNLKWGLVQLGLANDDEAKEFVTSDESGWGLRAWLGSNLGLQPEKWGDVLTKNIADAKEGIDQIKHRLAIMEKIAANIDAMGGWDVFREQYKEKLIEELAKKTDDN